jgi:hypothetical protein
MCTKLTFLHIGGARLTGTIPTEIGRLQELGGLSFHDNFLTGTVPSSIASLPTLSEYLSICIILWNMKFIIVD